MRGFSASWRAVPNHNLLPNSWGLGWVFPVSHYRVVMVTAKNYQFWVAFSSAVFGSQANRQFCPFWKTQYVRAGVRGENVKMLQSLFLPSKKLARLSLLENVINGRWYSLWELNFPHTHTAHTYIIALQFLARCSLFETAIILLTIFLFF